MDQQRLIRLLDALQSKRLHQFQHACSDSPLLGLLPKEVSIVEALSDQDALTMSELSQVTGFAMSTLTGIMDKLEAKGLLYRRRREEDKRIIEATLCDLGQDACHHRRLAKSQTACAILSRLSDAEQEQFVALLEKVVGCDSD